MFEIYNLTRSSFSLYSYSCWLFRCLLLWILSNVHIALYCDCSEFEIHWIPENLILQTNLSLCLGLESAEWDLYCWEYYLFHGLAAKNKIWLCLILNVWFYIEYPLGRKGNNVQQIKKTIFLTVASVMSSIIIVFRHK